MDPLSHLVAAAVVVYGLQALKEAPAAADYVLTDRHWALVGALASTIGFLLVDPLGVLGMLWTVIVQLALQQLIYDLVVQKAGSSTNVHVVSQPPVSVQPSHGPNGPIR